MLKILTVLSAALAALGFADYANLIDGFATLLPDWVAAFAVLVSAAAPLAALTPTKKDDRFLRKVKEVLNALGFNFGAAKNKEDDDA